VPEQDLDHADIDLLLIKTVAFKWKLIRNEIPDVIIANGEYAGHLLQNRSNQIRSESTLFYREGS
jgi:hypothetical protein